MLFRRRRREPATSWEVVEYKIVEPVPVCDEDDEGESRTRTIHVPPWLVTDGRYFLCPDLDIVIVAEEDMTRSFIFDFTKTAQAPNAVVFARQLLLQEIAKRQYNMLLTEG